MLTSRPTLGLQPEKLTPSTKSTLNLTDANQTNKPVSTKSNLNLTDANIDANQTNKPVSTKSNLNLIDPNETVKPTKPTLENITDYHTDISKSIVYYDKSQPIPPKQFPEQKQIGFTLTDNILKTDDGKLYAYVDNDWKEYPLSEEKTALKDSQLSDKKQKAEEVESNKLWIDMIKPDNDLIEDFIDLRKIPLGTRKFEDFYKGYNKFSEYQKAILFKKGYSFREADMYKHFYRKMYAAKIGTILRKLGVVYPYPDVKQMGLGNIPAIVQAEGAEIMQTGIQIGAGILGLEGPFGGENVPYISDTDWANVNYNDVVHNNVPLPNGMPISLYIGRGGDLPAEFITKLREESLYETRGTTKVKDPEKKELAYKNIAIRRQAIEVLNNIRISSVQSETKAIPQTENEDALGNLFSRILSTDFSIGFTGSNVEERKSGTNYRQIRRVLTYVWEQQDPGIFHRLLEIFNEEMGFYIPNIEDKDKLMNYIDDVLKFISRDTSKLTKLIIRLKATIYPAVKLADKKLFEPIPIQQGESEEKHFNPDELFINLRNIFIQSVIRTNLFDESKAGVYFDNMLNHLRLTYTTKINELGESSPENEVIAFESVLSLFVSKLLNLSEESVSRFSFVPEKFKEFSETLISLIKSSPEFNFKKLIEDIQSGHLENEMRRFYIDMRGPQSVNVLLTNEEKAIQVVSAPDIQIASEQIMQDAVNRNSNIILRARNFTVSSGRRNVIVPGAEEDDLILLIDQSGRQRIISLKRLAYLMALLGFIGGTITSIIEVLKNASDTDPPIDFPPLPPSGPTIPGGPSGPNVPGGPSKPGDIIPPNNIPQMNPSDTPEVSPFTLNATGQERPDTLDPAEAELFLMSQHQQEQEDRAWNEYSFVASGNGLGTVRSNPLLRHEVLQNMARFKNNIRRVPEQLTTQKIYLGKKDLGISKEIFSHDPTKQIYFIPQYESSFGKVDWRDAYYDPYNRDNKVHWTNPYENTNNTKYDRATGLFAQNVENPDFMLFQTGAENPNYKPVNDGQVNRPGFYFGLPKEKSPDHPNLKFNPVNLENNERVLKSSFQFGDTYHEEFGNAGLKKSVKNAYSNISKYQMAKKTR